jgi:NAD(P)-dependent dehydrogenase (short-subunit alcohol dehydrogenase family)
MKHYLIVGASSGIGFAVAKKLSSINRITAISRSEKDLPSLPNTTFHNVDISTGTAEFPSIEGPLDGIIYCPGTINLKPFRAIKDEDFQNEWNINVMGAIKTIRYYLPTLQQAEQPSIVLFSTVAVQNGMPFHSGIATAKGAVEGLTRSLAAEFAPKIRVNAIAPSLTQTPLADKLINTESKLKAAEDRHPLKFLGSADTIADGVLFLLNAPWTTGQILHIDGGMSAIR